MPRKSTIRVPEPTRLPSGRWRIQLQIDGRRLSVTEDDPKECQAKAVALKAGLIEQAAKPNRITLRAAIDKYIDSRSAVLSPSTIRGYRVIQRNRCKELMERPVSEITKDMLQRAVNADARRLSAKSVINSYLFITTVICQETGARFDISLPRLMPHERPFLTADEITMLLNAIRGTKAEAPILLGLQSLRRSEILGLRWCDLDLAHGTAHIRHTRVQGDKGMADKNTAKNSSSYRTIRLPQRLVDLLRDMPHGDDDSERIFSFGPNYIRANVNRVCKRLGLPEVGTHGLRHSFASLGYYLEVPAKVIQKAGGWSDDHTMLKIYTHVSEKYVERQRTALSNFFDEADKPTV